MPQCPQCGFEKFYESEGFFYCDICHVQSQDMRQTVNETEFAGQTTFARSNVFRIGSTVRPADEEGGEFAQGAKDSLFVPDQSESLFLLVDVVLRSQVEWLIQNAGARKQLTEVMQSVWFSYLSRALPDFKNGFVKSLVEGAGWRKTLRKSDISALTNCPVDDLTKLLKYWKAFPMDDSEGDENAVPVQNSCTPRKRPARARTSPQQPKKGRFYLEAGRLTFSRMMALLVIVLQICEESILISDLLRWIRLLQLPCTDPSIVLPDDQLTTFYLLNGTSNEPLTVSYHNLEWEVEVIRKFLEIPVGQLPSLSVRPMIERFVEELNLPRDLVVVVTELAEVIGLRWHVDFVSSTERFTRIRPQNPEALTMGLIIHGLILLFGLDDVTERRIARNSRLIEAVLDLDYFDVLDWMEYMERRRLVLFRHSPLLAARSISVGLEFVRRHLLTEKRTLKWARLKFNKHQTENYDDLQKAFQEAKFRQPLPDYFLDLSVTQRPFRAHTEALIGICPSLDRDFRLSSLAHVTGSPLPDELFSEVRYLLTGISQAQNDARKQATSLGPANISLTRKRSLMMSAVPSHAVRWLITVCSELIEQTPSALLGSVVFLEGKLYGKGKK